MVQGTGNHDGAYLRPVDVGSLGFPDTALPFLRNDVQYASAYNLIVECVNALRLCGSVSTPDPEGISNIDGTYPRPLTRTQVNFPTEPLPYFLNHIQQGQRWNFFVDAVNALRRCYIGAAGPTDQGDSISGGSYLPPNKISEIGFPDNPLTPDNYFPNDVPGATLFNYLMDALDLLRNCCAGCSAPDTTTTAATSGLSATKARGDDFSAWGLDDYELFLQDTVTNPNYEDSSRLTSTQYPGSVWSDEHLPGDLNGYFWEHFDDTDIAYPYHPPAEQPNRNRISQLAVNGGHRTIKAVKTSDDMPSLFHGFEIQGQDAASNVVGGTVTYNSLWARLVYQYSANYPLGDPAIGGALGTFLMDLKKTGTPTFVTTVATGTGAGGFFSDKLTIEHRVTGGTTFRASLGNTVDVVSSGTPRELVVYTGDVWDEFGVLVSGSYRVAVWMGDAFGTLTKLYDSTNPTANRTQYKSIGFMRPKAGPDLVPEGEDEMCYECIEWEYEAGGFGLNPYGVPA
jgi:hypothetical protein